MNRKVNHHYHTLINDKIAKFYMKRHDKDTEELEKYFTNKIILNFVEIAHLLFQKCDVEVEALQTYDYDHYLNCYRKLLPIFIQCSRVVEKLPLNALNLHWVGENYKFLAKVYTRDDNDGTTTVENALLLTAILEYALGNVYSTLNQDCAAPPHLLRDLIVTRELKLVFGANAVLFLKILLGTPKSINLRNIVWHGFPKCNEIPTYYVDVLLITMHTLGHILDNGNFKLQQRPLIPCFARLMKPFTEQIALSNVDAYSDADIKQFLETSQLEMEHQRFWQQLLHHYTNANYWQFVILILPQIELLLRLIYADANAFDVSAKLDEYYITIDTIFEREIPTSKSPNKLLSCETETETGITEGVLKCLYDVFLAPQGPRLRDKVSHGEVHMDAINDVAICRILLYLSLHLMAGNEAKFPMCHYESAFHANALARSELRLAQMQLHDFMQLEMPNAALTLDLSGNINAQPLRIFSRPRREAEFMLLINRIAHLHLQSSLNYPIALNERRLLLLQHELHSKRRRTLERILAALPQICATLCRILQSIESVFIKLQADNDAFYSTDAAALRLKRFLKHTLKICENFNKYSDKTSNEWIKALELCTKYNEIEQRFFDS